MSAVVALAVFSAVAWALAGTFARLGVRRAATALLRPERGAPTDAVRVHVRRGPVPDPAATLPDAVDLLAVAARAGLPAPAAVVAVASRAPPPWGAALAAVLGRTGRGERFVDALDQLVVGGGEAAQPLRSVLRAAAEDGADLVTGLERLGADARDARRRRAEEAARRLPVRLLLPLVACSLPAFALLSIVPIVAGAVSALDL